MQLRFGVKTGTQGGSDGCCRKSGSLVEEEDPIFLRSCTLPRPGLIDEDIIIARLGRTYLEGRAVRLEYFG